MLTVPAEVLLPRNSEWKTAEAEKSKVQANERTGKKMNDRFTQPKLFSVFAG